MWNNYTRFVAKCRTNMRQKMVERERVSEIQFFKSVNAGGRIHLVLLDSS